MTQRGTYQTRQQEAVEALFANRAEECLTADEVHKLLTDAGMEVGKTTVYRVITRLCQSGQIRRYAPQERGQSAHFQYNPCRESHLHIRCIHCGILAHLHCDEVESFSNHLNHHHGFSLSESQTILYGVCQECQKSKEESHAE